MSTSSTLSELAKLVALTSRSEKKAMRAARGLGQAMTEPGSRRMGEMVGTVLALASRTRRLAASPAKIELDVFGPTGRRAVRLACDATCSRRGNANPPVSL